MTCQKKCNVKKLPYKLFKMLYYTSSNFYLQLHSFFFLLEYWCNNVRDALAEKINKNVIKNSQCKSSVVLCTEIPSVLLNNWKQTNHFLIFQFPPASHRITFFDLPLCDKNCVYCVTFTVLCRSSNDEQYVIILRYTPLNLTPPQWFLVIKKIKSPSIFNQCFILEGGRWCISTLGGRTWQSYWTGCSCSPPLSLAPDRLSQSVREAAAEAAGLL